MINLYLELLKEREQREPKKFLKCHFFNTFFYKKVEYLFALLLTVHLEKQFDNRMTPLLKRGSHFPLSEALVCVYRELIVI